ncbi:hydrolase [Streptomyces sp. 4N509B]|uniref:hydrolase n=1 Tax=Streptomyces sp. 4N509B TaxID=3457413 RepID=UPI003FD6934B
MARSATRSWRAPASAAALALALAAAGTTTAFGDVGASASEPDTAQQPSCAADGFCEDFESQTGGAPSGRWAFEARDCTGTGSVAVDTSVAHGGTTSLRVDGGQGYCNHAFAATDLTEVPAGSELYVRFWVRHSTALPTQHVTFLAMEDDNTGRDLRMGGQNAALQWNRETDDATLPAQSPAGVALSAPLPVNEWSCVEYQISPATGHIQTWLNGTSVEGLVVDDVPDHDIDRQWLANGTWSPALVDLRLGWESYGEGADTLWYDDVAVGTARVGCA